MARRQQGRIARQGAARHSEMLSKGVSGDPRDHRREAQRLTDADLDPKTLAIVDGRLTVVNGAGASGVATPELVDQTTGTALEAVPEIADLASAPASATALRDELVQTTLPAIRDALATLAAAVNALRGS